MKIRVWQDEDHLLDIQHDIKIMIENREINEIISMTNSSTPRSKGWGSCHSVILIYR